MIFLQVGAWCRKQVSWNFHTNIYVFSKEATRWQPVKSLWVFSDVTRKKDSFHDHKRGIKCFCFSLFPKNFSVQNNNTWKLPSSLVSVLEAVCRVNLKSWMVGRSKPAKAHENWFPPRRQIWFSQTVLRMSGGRKQYWKLLLFLFTFNLQETFMVRDFLTNFSAA